MTAGEIKPNDESRQRKLIEFVQSASASPEVLDRLLFWFEAVVGNGAILDTDRFARVLRWQIQGSILDLDDDQFKTVLDYVIVERSGPNDPELQPHEVEHHDRVANPD